MPENDSQPLIELTYQSMHIQLFVEGVIGKEVLYVNNQQVSKNFGLKSISHHEFEWNDGKWALSFDLNLETGQADCSLIHNNSTVVKQVVPFHINNKILKTIAGYMKEEPDDDDTSTKTPPAEEKSSRSFTYIALALKLFKSAKAIQLALVGASFASYSFFFDWQFAVIILMALMFHEYGHMQAMKKMGMKVKGMYLIPFIGGAAVSSDKFQSRWENIYVSMMGPFYGLLLTIAFFVFYLVTDSSLAAGLASFSALLNLINLLPIVPLDGGHVLKAVAASTNHILGQALLWLGMLLSIFISWKLGLSLFAFLVIIGVLDLIFSSDDEDESVVPLTNSGVIVSMAWYVMTAAALIGMIFWMDHLGIAGSSLVTTILSS